MQMSVSFSAHLYFPRDIPGEVQTTTIAIKTSETLQLSFLFEIYSSPRLLLQGVLSSVTPSPD
jgi:hypothetical protein